MKRLLAIFLFLILLAGCSSAPTPDKNLKVVATLFPQYDFAKAIGGDKINITLLLKPGTDSHSFEPTGTDMLEISDSDIFIYTGEAMESWAQTILDSVAQNNLRVLNVSEGIEVAYINEHEHSHLEDNEDHSHGVYDPHIWTDPQNAEIIVSNILKAFIDADPENKTYYTQNAN